MRGIRGDRAQEGRFRLGKLTELGKALLVAESTEAVAEAAIRRIRDLVPAKHLSVVVFDADAAQATVIAAYSQGKTKGGGGSRWRLDAFGSLDRMSTGRALVVDDLRGALALPPAVGALARDGIGSILIAPLVSDGELEGALFVGRDSAYGFSSEDAEVAAETGEIVAPALKRARRMEHLLEHAVALEHRVRRLERSGHEQRTLLGQVALAQEQERQRIAVDIHDDSVQVMTTAALRLQVLRREISNQRHTELLEELDDTIRHAISRLRHLMFELVPPALDGEGLAPALTVYLERVQEDTGLRPHLHDRLLGQPPTELRAAIYRIVQEAVRNVVKHARARSVSIVLDEHEEGFLARIIDDGVGFSIDDVESRLPMHLGLTAMRQRAEMAGGWCRIRSMPGAGTTVEAWIPGEASAFAASSERAATSA